MAPEHFDSSTYTNTQTQTDTTTLFESGPFFEVSPFLIQMMQPLDEVFWGPALEASTIRFEIFIQLIDEVFEARLLKPLFFEARLLKPPQYVFWGPAFEAFTIRFEALRSLMRFFEALFLKLLRICSLVWGRSGAWGIMILFKG